MNIPLALPDITSKEIKEVKKVMKSNVLSIGPKTIEFENKIEEYVGVKHAIAVCNGTCGLHLLVRAMKIERDDEVITTPFSFVASTNCLLYEGVKPVFVDISPNTLNIDIEKIEEKINEKTKAILPVDVFGHPLDMKKIMKLAEKYKLKVIEDSCEAFGSEFDGEKSGSGADGAVFAFYPNKQITTGEGGVIVTNSDDIASACRSMRNQGRSPHGTWLDHERLGFNYRMNELNAAIGCIQMDRIEEILRKREDAAEIYNERLRKIEGIKVPYIAPDVTRMSWFVYVIRFDESLNRDRVMEYLINNGISCKPYFPTIHLQPYMKEQFGYKEGDFPITEKTSKSSLALPFFNKLSASQIEYIAKKLEESIRLME